MTTDCKTCHGRIFYQQHVSASAGVTWENRTCQACLWNARRYQVAVDELRASETLEQASVDPDDVADRIFNQTVAKIHRRDQNEAAHAWAETVEKAKLVRSAFLLIAVWVACLILLIVVQP